MIDLSKEMPYNLNMRSPHNRSMLMAKMDKLRKLTSYTPVTPKDTEVKTKPVGLKKGGSVTARGQGAVMKKRPTKNY
jgi:hypothetical protein